MKVLIRSYFLFSLIAFFVILNFQFKNTRFSFAEKLESTGEYESKSTFLYYFLKYSEWPNQKGIKEYKIAILGKDPFGEKINILKKQKVLGKTISIHKVKSVEDALDCHLLFICDSEKDRYQNIFSVLETRPILTVGENEGFLKAGGMINFIREDKKIRYKIQAAKVKKSKITISSYLLRLSR